MRASRSDAHRPRRSETMGIASLCPSYEGLLVAITIAS